MHVDGGERRAGWAHLLHDLLLWRLLLDDLFLGLTRAGPGPYHDLGTTRAELVAQRDQWCPHITPAGH